MTDTLKQRRILQELVTMRVRPMRRMLRSISRIFVSAVVPHAAVLSGVLALGALADAPAAHAGAAGPGPGVTGNDVGGIIQSVPGMGRSYEEIAADHCARYGRFAGISSVRRVYGGYIGFQCVYDRRYDPRKMGLPQPE
jgi:hypothetical protein